MAVFTTGCVPCWRRPPTIDPRPAYAHDGQVLKATDESTVPLFPLRTVLFPGGPLPLRVFEPRYLAMVSDCMKNETPFGVLLLADGPEVGGESPSRTTTIGTLAHITDWYQGTDGILGITATGSRRFRLLETERRDDGLNVGRIVALPEEPAVPVPADYVGWANLLEAVLDDLGKLYETVDRRFDDAGWLGFRFAEILPLDMTDRQRCLEMNDPVERLEFLRPVLRQVREGQVQ